MRPIDRKFKIMLCLMQATLLLAPLPALSATSGTAGKSAKTGLLKPMSPQLDVASPPAALPPISPEPGSAPEMVHHTYDHPRNSTLDERENPVGDILQQAMDAYSQGNMSLAEKLFKAVLARDASNTDALYNLGAIAEQKGNLDGALMDYQAALKSSPQDSDVQQAVNSLQAKIQQKGAAKARATAQAEQAAQQQQQQGQLKKLAGDAAQAYKSGNYDLAVRNLETVAQQAPNDPDVRFGLAQAYRGKGDFNRARYNLTQALNTEPNNPQYQQAMTQLNQQAKSAGGSGSRSSGPATAEGMPPIAPDMHSRGSGSGSSGNYGMYPSPGDSIASNTDSDDAPEGQITPFSSDAVPRSSGSQYGGVEAYGNYGGGGRRGLASFLPGAIGMSGGSYYGGMPGGSRLQRAAINGLAGAAMGGLTSRMSGGSMKSGAIMGGLMGLFMGGF